MGLDCREHLASCFSSGYNFAGDQSSRVAALDYLRCNVEALNAWLGIQQEIKDYLRAMNAPESEIQKQVERAGTMLRPWVA
ncbi:hypothetical protein BROWWM01_43490 [Bradyrhizobium ottawaense]